MTASLRMIRKTQPRVLISHPYRAYENMHQCDKTLFDSAKSRNFCNNMASDDTDACAWYGRDDK